MLVIDPNLKRKQGFDLTKPIGLVLYALAREILEEARSAIDDTQITDAVAVHEFRKAMKRWRAFLRLVGPHVEAADRLRVEARDVARELAQARDAQAVLDALDDLVGGAVPLSERSLATMRGRIEAQRQQVEVTALSEAMRTRMRNMLGSAFTSLDHWSLTHVGFGDLARSIAEGYRRMRRMQPEDWSAASADELHEMRKTVVVHRYQMELVESLWPKQGRLWVAETQRLRDRLGAHQNLDVLRRLTEPHQLLAPWRSRLDVPIEARQRDHVTASRRIAGRLLAEKPNAFRRRLAALWEAAAAAAPAAPAAAIGPIAADEL